MAGPLTGYRILEIAGIGPGPFAAMMLSDMGAEVIRIDRADAVTKAPPGPSSDLVNRGRRSLAIDLKQSDGVALVLKLVESANGLIEGFRPGVMERLGLGPDVCMEHNPALVYGRMTGWGQDGPYAHTAGHDINYIALAGALEPIGRAGQPPTPPLNLVGDYGGGGLMLAFGVVCGLLESRESGRGQVVDAAMVDGAALLTTVFHSLTAQGSWNPERGTNVIDSGAPFYDVYECSDGHFISIGAIEPQFYALLRKLAGLDDLMFDNQLDKSQWPAMKLKVAEVFLQRSRDEWCEVLEHTDACFAPVLSLLEAPRHAHNVARHNFVENAGVVQPAPAPRFSRTEPSIQRPPSRPGEHSDEILRDWGVNEGEINSLRTSGAIA